MRNATEPQEANRQYAAAYSAHYIERDLPTAMRIYKQVISAYPTDPEAEYSRVQIQNIVNTVVPKLELLDAQMQLAAKHFGHCA